MTKDRETLQPQVEHEISPKPSAERKPPEESAAAQAEAKAGGLLARWFGKKEKREGKEAEQQRISEFCTAINDVIDDLNHAADSSYKVEAMLSRRGGGVAGESNIDAMERATHYREKAKEAADSLQSDLDRARTAFNVARSLARQFSPDQKVATMRALQEQGRGLPKELERMPSINEILEFLDTDIKKEVKMLESWRSFELR